MGIQVFDEAPAAEDLLMTEGTPPAVADEDIEEEAEQALSTVESARPRRRAQRVAGGGRHHGRRPAGARDGSCLTAEQKTMVAEIHTGAKTSAGAAIYSTFQLDPGIANQDWATWEFVIGQVLDPLSSGTVFSTPPVQQTLATANIDQLAASIFATNATFTESSMSFMTPPNPTELAKLKGRGAKVMVFHGTGDAVFS